METGLEEIDINQSELLQSSGLPQNFKISPIKEDPNLVYIFYVEKVNAIFGNTQNLVIS